MVWYLERLHGRIKSINIVSSIQGYRNLNNSKVSYVLWKGEVWGSGGGVKIIRGNYQTGVMYYS